jgi:uncharacterized membrane protein
MTFSRLGSCLRYAVAALPLVVLLAVCCDPAYAGHPLYAINDLTPTSCAEVGQPQSEGLPVLMTGNAINANGDVVGYALCTAQLTYLYNSATNQLSVFTAEAGSFAVNNKQQIAGEAFAVGRPIVFTTGGSFTFIGPGFGDAFDLNNKGVVVGDVAGHAFKWNAGILSDLDARLGGKGSTASAINDRNEITGVSNAFGAFLLSPTGKVTQLGTLGGGTTTPERINIYAETTGCSMRADGTTHAFLWQQHRLRDLGPPGVEFSCGFGINDDGAVVGCTEAKQINSCARGSLFGLFEGPPPATSLALLWQSDDVYDLNQLIDKRDPLYGIITLYSAMDINDAGQIAANGCFTAGDRKGQCTAVRLDPVMEVAHRR